MIQRIVQIGVLALTLAVAPVSIAAASPDSSATTEGTATWYGSYFQGRPMANGEIFNMWDPTTTAANIYPLGTWLQVTNLDTGRSIVVRVTDTGGFHKINPTTVVDLSYAAFARIADPDDGRIPVRVERAIPRAVCLLVSTDASECMSYPVQSGRFYAV